MQVATFVITGLLVVGVAAALRGVLPRRRTGTLAVALLGLLGAALMLAAFRVDVRCSLVASLKHGTAGYTGSPSC